jgi:hypothetical protein
MPITIEDVKAAFWAHFFESGEAWFPYRSMGATEEECAAAVEVEWTEFFEEMGRARLAREEGNGNLRRPDVPV